MPVDDDAYEWWRQAMTRGPLIPRDDDDYSVAPGTYPVHVWVGHVLRISDPKSRARILDLGRESDAREFIRLEEGDE